jgi:hypothetical protein
MIKKGASHDASGREISIAFASRPQESANEASYHIPVLYSTHNNHRYVLNIASATLTRAFNHRSPKIVRPSSVSHSSFRCRAGATQRPSVCLSDETHRLVALHLCCVVFPSVLPLAHSLCPDRSAVERSTLQWQRGGFAERGRQHAPAVRTPVHGLPSMRITFRARELARESG